MEHMDGKRLHNGAISRGIKDTKWGRGNVKEHSPSQRKRKSPRNSPSGARNMTELERKECCKAFARQSASTVGAEKRAAPQTEGGGRSCSLAQLSRAVAALEARAL